MIPFIKLFSGFLNKRELQESTPDLTASDLKLSDRTHLTIDPFQVESALGRIVVIAFC